MRSIATCLLLLAAAATSWGQPPPAPLPVPVAPAAPLQFTITGPKECFVDQPATFEVKVRNTSTDPQPSRKLLVQVQATQTTVQTRVVKESVTNAGGTVTERMRTVVVLVPFVTQLFPGSAVLGQEELAVKALAAGETQTLPLKLTFKQHGQMTINLGPNGGYGYYGTADGLADTGTNVAPNSYAPNFFVSGQPLQVNVTLDPQTPLKDLLPAAPKTTAAMRLPETLEQVPELGLEEGATKFAAKDESLVQAVRRVAKINHLNRKKADGYMEALLNQRSDLAGLPFAMGDACRLKDERGRQFGSALASLRESANPTPAPVNFSSGQVSPPWLPVKGHAGERLMDAFRKQTEASVQTDNRLDPRTADDIVPARVAALMQVMPVETEQLQEGLVKYLAATAHVDATRGLAKLAIFSEEAKVRTAALEALKTRRERDYTDLLVQGLSYPWPAVAKRSSEAIIALGRTDLLPELLSVLERPDPRAPQVQEKEGKQTNVVRELVRINHHRNCLLCHAPSDPQESFSSEKVETLRTLLVQLPLPDQELPRSAPSGGYYDSSNPDILVRIDVTYLRQDFSVKLPVKHADPWPEMQRYDFVVRTREVSGQEAKAYRDQLEPGRPGVLSPYHRAALVALREMTGLDTAPNAEAWRKLLSQTSTR